MVSILLEKMSVGIPWHQWHLKTCWSARVHKDRGYPSLDFRGPKSSHIWSLTLCYVCLLRLDKLFSIASMIKSGHVPLQYLALVWTQIAHCTWLKEIGYNEQLQNQDRNGLHLICIHVGPTKSNVRETFISSTSKGVWVFIVENPCNNTCFFTLFKERSWLCKSSRYPSPKLLVKSWVNFWSFRTSTCPRVDSKILGNGYHQIIITWQVPCWAWLPEKKYHPSTNQLILWHLMTMFHHFPRFPAANLPTNVA